MAHIRWVFRDPVDVKSGYLRVKVAFYHRKRTARRNFSLEGYFEAVRAYLPSSIEPSIVVAPCASRGVVRRVVNMIDASLRQADVNHVTGDIHYVTYLLKRKRTILTIADCRFENMQSVVRRTLLKWFWYDLPVYRASVVTVISEYTKQRLLTHVRCDPDKIRVIPVCISQHFKAQPKPFNSEYPTLLQVGTAPNKNLDRVCAAIADMRCHLRIVGPLSMKQRDCLASYGIDYSNICDLSEEEVVREYVASDIVTFVSTYEGFGMPILEANCVGRPVVTSRVTSMPEVAADAACLVDPFDTASIRAGIQRVANDERYRERIVENGFRNQLRFGPEVIADRFLSLYNEIAADVVS